MLHRSRGDELDAPTLYALLRLRTDVFVVEQACAYPELDGLDLSPTTEHLWFARGPEPVACLRVLREPAATRLGRLATRPRHRGSGLARRLVELVLAEQRGEVVLEAQAHLRPWYASMGFVVDGPEVVLDGIPHVPMRRGAPG